MHLEFQIQIENALCLVCSRSEIKFKCHFQVLVVLYVFQAFLKEVSTVQKPSKKHNNIIESFCKPEINFLVKMKSLIFGLKKIKPKKDM